MYHIDYLLTATSAHIRADGFVMLLKVCENNLGLTVTEWLRTILKNRLKQDFSVEFSQLTNSLQIVVEVDNQTYIRLAQSHYSPAQWDYLLQGLATEVLGYTIIS